MSAFARFLVLAAATCSCGLSLAQVTPPPLPAGSDRVAPLAGLQEAERKRYVRAHHHKFLHKKDATANTTPPVPVDTHGRGRGRK
jgi:hypothetical protein